QKITQSARAPAVPRFGIVKSGSLAMKGWNRRLNIRQASSLGSARQVPIPSHNAQIIVNAHRGPLCLPAFNNLIEAVATPQESRGGADDHMRVCLYLG